MYKRACAGYCKDVRIALRITIREFLRPLAIALETYAPTICNRGDCGINHIAQSSKKSRKNAMRRVCSRPVVAKIQNAK